MPASALASALASARVSAPASARVSILASARVSAMTSVLASVLLPILVVILAANSAVSTAWAEPAADEAGTRPGGRAAQTTEAPAAEPEAGRPPEQMPPCRIGQIRFHGNETFRDEEFVPWMRQRPSRLIFRCDYHPAEFLQDLERLRRFYYGEGFLSAEIRGVADSTAAFDGRIDLDIFIEEGPRWTLLSRELQLTGPEQSPALADSLLDLVQAEGPGPFRLRALVLDRDRMYRLLAGRGLADARAVVHVARDDVCRTAKLRYVVDTGPRARLREIRIHGLRRTRPEVVTREVALRPGDVLRPEQLGRARANLLHTGLFSDVVVAPAAADSGLERKHLIIAVRERAGGAIGAGGGYATSDRLRVTASIEHRNVLGRGLRFALRGVFGQRRLGGEAELAAPWTLGRRLGTTVTIGHERLTPRSYEAEITRGALHISRQLNRRWKSDLGYTAERLRVFEGDKGRPEPSRLAFLSGAIARESRDNLLFPRRGSYLRIDQDWTSTLLGSELNFTRTEAQYQRHYPVGPLTFAGRLRAGALSQPAPARPIPIPERFFAGGLGTIRGFPDDAVGPADSTGTPVGGNMLLAGAAEVRFPVWGRLSGVVFGDAGQLVDDLDGFARREVSVGAGFGLRLDTSLGRLRLYAGWPVTRRFGDGAQLYVGGGSGF